MALSRVDIPKTIQEMEKEDRSWKVFNKWERTQKGVLCTGWNLGTFRIYEKTQWNTWKRKQMYTKGQGAVKYRHRQSVNCYTVG